jgi:hypothetical protein
LTTAKETLVANTNLLIGYLMASVVSAKLTIGYLMALVVNTNLQIVLASGSIRYKMSQAYSQSFQSQNFLQQNKNKVQKNQNSFSGSMFLLCVINGFEIRRFFLSKSYFVSILFLSTSWEIFL